MLLEHRISNKSNFNLNEHAGNDKQTQFVRHVCDLNLILQNYLLKLIRLCV